MSIRIIVDSASDITQEEAKKLDITIVPMEISFGDNTYKDGIDIDSNRFYEMLLESDELPKTSQPSPYSFIKEYEKVNSNDDILVITISSKLSGTYQSAILASKEFNNVHIVDSLNASVGIRLLILHAIKLRDAGKSVFEIEEELNKAKHEIVLIAMLDTLEYLKKGGRVSGLVSFAAELFSIKPVIGIQNGEVKVIGKARGSKNKNNFLNKEIEKNNGVDFSMPLAVIYSGFEPNSANKYIEDSQYLWEGNIDHLPIYPIGSTIGTHIGPGAIGVAFFRSKDE